MTGLPAVPAAPNRAGARAIAFALCVLLAAVAAIPLAAVWQAFGPKAAAPDFTLVDGDARPFTLAAQRGHPVVLFFGYTRCPDTCPTTLAHLAQAVRVPDVPRDVRVAFVTVDPARDTPALLARYARLFDPHFIGLTGTARTLDTVYSAYHVWSRPVAIGRPGSDYIVGHGTTIYYIGRDGSLRNFGRWDDTVPAIARQLRELG
jgi:protein SCO1/2